MLSSMLSLIKTLPAERPAQVPRVQREFILDNLLVRIHCIIVMIRWTGLAPWEFEFTFPGRLTSTFLASRSTPSAASVGLADYSEVDMLGLWYKSENFAAKKARARQIGEPEKTETEQ